MLPQINEDQTVARNFHQWREPQQQQEQMNEDHDNGAQQHPSSNDATKFKTKTIIKTTPIIDLLCRFNGSCSPNQLHRQIRKRQQENLNYLQELSGMTHDDVAESGIGQRELLPLEGDKEEEEDDDPDSPSIANLFPRKPRMIVTNHLKHGRQYEIFPSKLTRMGADHVLALRGYLRINIR